MKKILFVIMTILGFLIPVPILDRVCQLNLDTLTIHVVYTIIAITIIIPICKIIVKEQGSRELAHYIVTGVLPITMVIFLYLNQKKVASPLGLGIYLTAFTIISVIAIYHVWPKSSTNYFRLTRLAIRSAMIPFLTICLIQCGSSYIGIKNVLNAEAQAVAMLLFTGLIVPKLEKKYYNETNFNSCTTYGSSDIMRDA